MCKCHPDPFFFQSHHLLPTPLIDDRCVKIWRSSCKNFLCYAAVYLTSNLGSHRGQVADMHQPLGKFKFIWMIAMQATHVHLRYVSSLTCIIHDHVKCEIAWPQALTHSVHNFTINFFGCDSVDNWTLSITHKVSWEIQPAHHIHQPTNQQGTKWSGKAYMCPRKHILGQKLFWEGAKVLVPTHQKSTYAPSSRWLLVGPMGQKCQHLAKNASFGPNLAVFGPKIQFFGGRE